MGNSLSLQLLWQEPEGVQYGVNHCTLYLKTASLRCVAKHRIFQRAKCSVWLHESYIIFPHSTLSSFTDSSCARAPKKTVGRLPESLHELMKPENRHFLDELHEEAWEARLQRLEVDVSFAIFVGETKASQLENMFITKQPCGRWIRWRVAIPPLRSGVVVMGNGGKYDKTYLCLRNICTGSMLTFRLQRIRFLIWFHSFCSAWIRHQLIPVYINI